jgi:DNA-binding CsgD family transcriptional regulator
MFNIKVFAGFEAAPAAAKPDRLFLQELLSVRNETGARYVNFSVLDYKKENPDTVHFLTCPMQWITHYVRSFYSGFDPLLSFDFRRASIIDWHDIYLGREALEMLAKFSEMGIGDHGLSIVTHAGNNVFCAMSLVFACAPQDWPRLRSGNADLYRFQCDRLGEKYFELYTGLAKPQSKLTRRECQVLQFVALGNTDDMIAGLMGIGRWTVVSHIQSAKYKLGCSNRTAAVAFALSTGLIEYNKAV